MHAYGLPRNHDIESPDCGDLFDYALKSSRGHLARKNGQYHGAVRDSDRKRRSRRFWKKEARRAAKAEIADLLIHRKDG